MGDCGICWEAMSDRSAHLFADSNSISGGILLAQIAPATVCLSAASKLVGRHALQAKRAKQTKAHGGREDAVVEPWPKLVRAAVAKILMPVAALTVEHTPSGLVSRSSLAHLLPAVQQLALLAQPNLVSEMHCRRDGGTEEH